MSKEKEKSTGRRKPKYKTYFLAWRKARGLTQQGLADLLGTNKTRVTMKERDLESWDKDYLDALSKALSVDTWSLLYRDPDADNADEAKGFRVYDDLSPESKTKALDYMRDLKLADKARRGSGQN